MADEKKEFLNLNGLQIYHNQMSQKVSNDIEEAVNKIAIPKISVNETTETLVIK